MVAAVIGSVQILCIKYLFNKYSEHAINESMKTNSKMDKSKKENSLTSIPILFWMVISLSFLGYAIIVNLIMMSQ